MKFWEFCDEHPIVTFLVAFMLLGTASDIFRYALVGGCR